MSKTKVPILKKSGNSTRIVFLVVMALLLVSGAMLFNTPHQTEVFQINFPHGVALQGEVANTPEKLLFGLAFRERLRPDGALLLIFDESGPHTVWTKAFQIPVDLIWVDESKHIVHLVRDAEPCHEDKCPRFGPPPEHARYIIETNAGFIRGADVQIGHELTFALHM
ncbi:MAG: DUF192 domain-containing protein [Nitrospirota bacterium]|nr:DUF192 domain-containing protein [Nitrospirota bacterium]